MRVNPFLSFPKEILRIPKYVWIVSSVRLASLSRAVTLYRCGDSGDQRRGLGILRETSLPGSASVLYKVPARSRTTISTSDPGSGALSFGVKTTEDLSISGVILR